MIFVRFRGVLRPWSRFYREYEDNAKSLIALWLVDYLQIKHTWIETWKDPFLYIIDKLLSFLSQYLSYILHQLVMSFTSFICI